MKNMNIMPYNLNTSVKIFKTICLLAFFVIPILNVASSPVSNQAGLSADDNATWWDGFGTTGTNGLVNSIVVDQTGYVYAGGVFSSAGGLQVNSLARWDGSRWYDLNHALRSVLALAVDKQSNIYVAEYGGDSTYYVSKWDGEEWTQLGDGANDTIYALAVDSAGNLYAGGNFSMLGSVTVNHIARWNGSQWQPLYAGSIYPPGTDGPVYALAVDAMDFLYVGGDFLQVEGNGFENIVKWDNKNQHWIGIPIGHGVNGPVRALAFDPSNKLYVGGQFTYAGGHVPANNIAYWDGIEWFAMSDGLGNGGVSIVMELATDLSGNVYAGGDFTNSGALTVNHIARWNGAEWEALGSGFDWPVEALATDLQGDLYAGGPFTTVDDKIVNRITRWDGNNWQILSNGPNNFVNALMEDASGHIYVGGEFTSLGGAAAKGIAEWDGNTWQALGSGVDGNVNALLEGGSVIYAAGYFPSAGGVPANHIAQWDGVNWQALGDGVNGEIFALAYGSGDILYAGGAFTTAGGSPASRVAAWDGSQWNALGAGVNDDVRVLVVDALGNLYAGGWFTSAGGQPASHLARWDGTQWQALSSQVNGDVYALIFDPTGNLYAGGYFTMAGGLAASRVARWDGSQWQNVGAGVNGPVHTLALDASGNLIAGGGFTSAGAILANRIAWWDGSGWNALGSGLNNYVRTALVDSQGELYTGGLFTEAGGKPSSYLAWHFKPYAISGSVIDDASNPIPGVLLSIGPGRFTTTQENGTYLLENLAASSYLLQPFKDDCYGCNFSPLSRQVLITTTSQIDEDFTFSYAISGRIIDSYNHPVAGITLSTGSGCVAITDDEGFYTLTDLSPGAYIVTPSQENFLFTPASIQVNLMGSQASGVDFTGDTPGYAVIADGFSIPGFSVPGHDPAVHALAIDNNDQVYAGGDFLTVGGITVNNIAKWNGSQWLDLEGGVNGVVTELALDAAGNLYIGGGFTMAGSTSANHIAKWDGVRWRSLGTGVNSYVSSLEFDPVGNLYVGGSFTSAGGLPVHGIAKWDGSQWHVLENWADAGIYALAVNTSGEVYAGGSIRQTWDRPLVYLAKWNGVEWVIPGGGVSCCVSDLAVDNSGILYAAGSFTSANLLSTRYIAKWDGLRWSGLGNGLNNEVRSIALDTSGNLYAGGAFAGSYSYPDYGISIWNGDGWQRVASLDGDYSTNAFVLDSSRNLYVGGAFTLAGGIVSNHIALFKKLHFIFGNIWDKNSDPLESAVVTANDVYSVTTSASGSYVIIPPAGSASLTLSPPAAHYTITPSLIGCSGCAFIPEQRQVTITDTDVTDQDFTATLLLSISGVVRDGSSQPVAGVTISAGGGYTAVTGVDGAYTLADLPPGEYTLTPGLAGCSGCTFMPEQRQVTITDTDVTDQDFTATLLLSISGVVRDGSSQPVAGVTISAGGGYSAITGVDGAYTLADLPPGEYTLTPGLAGCSDCTFMPEQRQVTLTNADVSDQDFTTTLLMAIFGSVTDGSSQPVAGVMISAGGGYTAVTGVDGAFTLADLPPGEYTLTPGLAGCSGCTFMPEQRQVTIADTDVTDQDFAATLLLSISGAVRDGSSQPVAGVTISAGGGYTAVTGVDGAYTLADLPPGEYTLTPILTSCPDCTFLPAQRQVTLTTADSFSQNFLIEFIYRIFLALLRK